MYTIRFSVLQPFDALLRALDNLRKMGFGLLGMNIAQCGSHYVTELRFEVRGNLTADTFVERLRLHDIADLVVAELASEAFAREELDQSERRGASWTFQ
jgi:hypothetical protein